MAGEWSVAKAIAPRKPDGRRKAVAANSAGRTIEFATGLSNIRERACDTVSANVAASRFAELTSELARRSWHAALRVHASAVPGRCSVFSTAQRWPSDQLRALHRRGAVATADIYGAVTGGAGSELFAHGGLFAQSTASAHARVFAHGAVLVPASVGV